ncbi:unnamed protein product [Sphenostylis stenocarpa]|uniref:Uncharacterized protein n=1 Tax=Sphenostylis stenocarpa TaxID=92480 RepID=A0AA86SHA9_9FABA|nr:unnamed protein product [Sphenostylis stenocarpa]
MAAIGVHSNNLNLLESLILHVKKLNRNIDENHLKEIFNIAFHGTVSSRGLALEDRDACPSTWRPSAFSSLDCAQITA